MQYTSGWTCFDQPPPPRDESSDFSGGSGASSDWYRNEDAITEVSMPNWKPLGTESGRALLKGGCGDGSHSPAGYFTVEGASDNDTMPEAVGDRLANLGLPFDTRQRRICRLGHIINLVVISFLFGENRTPLLFPVSSGTPEEEIQRLRERWKQGTAIQLHSIHPQDPPTSRQIR